jgi:hypothetical protein
MTANVDERTVWERQREEIHVNRFAAARQLYSKHKSIQFIWTTISLLIPIISTFLAGIASDQALAILTLATLTVGIVEILLWGWLQKHIRDAARIHELYDCELLKIPWNETDPIRPDGAQIEEYARIYRAKVTPEEIAGLGTWYAEKNANHPIRRARILCQNENLRWDSALREKWAWYIIWVLVIVVVLVALVIIIFRITQPQLLVGSAILLTLTIVSGARAVLVHRQIAEEKKELRQFVVKLLPDIDNTRVSDEKLRQQSRSLQDKIYATRRALYTVPDWFYKRNQELIQANIDQAAPE